MRIAVIGIRGIPANYGGLETCAEQTTLHWARTGDDVLVYCRKKCYQDRPPTIGGVRLKYTWSIASKSLDTLTHSLFAIIDCGLRERSYRTVHLYNTGNGILLLLLKLFGKRVVMSGDGLEWKRQKWGLLAKLMHKLGERAVVRLADEIVVDNQVVMDYYKRKYSAETTLIAYGAKVIGPVPEISAPLLARHGLREGRYFIFVGRLVPEKNVDRLIDAYQQLNTGYPLVIVGDDASRTPYRDGIFARASEKVRPIGFLYGEEYEQLLVNAAMYVSASSLEGTSPSLLSAMAGGICCLVNGIEENIATTERTVALFEKDDFDDLVRQWQKLIDDPALARSVAARGYEHVSRHYRWEGIAENYQTLFRKIAATG